MRHQGVRRFLMRGWLYQGSAKARMMKFFKVAALSLQASTPTAAIFIRWQKQKRLFAILSG